jgi:hypothetical protein
LRHCSISERCSSHIEQPLAVALIDVVEAVILKPRTEELVVARALRLVGARRRHRVGAPDIERLTDRQPVGPGGVVLVAPPRVLPALDVGRAIGA